MGLFRSRFVWSDGKTTRRLNSYDASRNAGSESGQCGSQRERLELISRWLTSDDVGTETRD